VAIKLTESDRLAIVAARTQGVPVGELAARYGVHRNTITNLLAELKAGIQKTPQQEFDAQVYRNTLRRKSYVAVEAGLDCQDDQYKRANVGTTVLKGLGDFDGADVNVNVQAMIAAIPEELRWRYVGGSATPAVDNGGDCTIVKGRYLTSVPRAELEAYQAQGWELIPQGEDGKQ